PRANVVPLSVAFSPDGGRLAWFPEEGKVMIWDVAAGKGVKVLGGPCRLRSVVLRPGGQQLAASGWDRGIDVGDLAQEGARRNFTVPGHAGVLLLTDVAFSPNGQILAACGRRGAWLWNVSTGEVLCRLQAPQGFLSMAFNRDGQILATGSVDPT